ncbi:MAG: alpha/beta hydrolase [Candidatus Rokuibacteriota bacterium]|nr:MAG: alpha/beta hydrolase [Candidatus Rokubacteria bacterium]
MSTQTIGSMVLEVDGQGDALVMLHGLGGTSNTFFPQMSLLASRLRVIRPDLPGSGRSSLSGPLSIQGLTVDVVGTVRALGIERAHLAGHSLGAIVCFHVAVRYPALVASLALFGPLLAPPETARRAIRERAAAVRVGGMQSTADTIVQASLSAETRANRPVVAALVREMLMRQNAEGYARTCEALAEATAAEVRDVKCPTLLVTGDEDPIAPPTTVRAIGDRMSDARTVVLSRCGHWTTLERPQDVNAALRDFYFGRSVAVGTQRARARYASRAS